MFLASPNWLRSAYRKRAAKAIWLSTSLRPRGERMRRPTLLLALVLLALLGAMAAKGLLAQPPAVREHNAAGEFDAIRAKARLADVLGDQRPHPSDSDAD